MLAAGDRCELCKGSRRLWTADDEPFPVASASEVHVIDVSVEDADRLALGLALLGTFEVATVDEIEQVRVEYLGRKSELKLALREVRDRETGMALNAVREAQHARQVEQLLAELAEATSSRIDAAAVPAAPRDARRPPARRGSQPRIREQCGRLRRPRLGS